MICDFCGLPMVSNGHRIVNLKNAILTDRKCYVKLYCNRYYCKGCGVSKTQTNPLSLNYFSISYSTIFNIMNHLKNLNNTLESISLEFNISDTTVNNYIDSFIVLPKVKLPEWIGIDEIHNPRLASKGSAYLCVITDGQNRKLLDILSSRGKRFLYDYFDFYFTKEERENVKFVSMDMWEPYKEDAKKLFPNCIVAVDPFHYVKHLCDGFEKLRIRIMKVYIYKSDAYYLLKEWNWLLTTDNVDLDNEPQYNRVFGKYLNRRDIYNMLLENFPELNKAYHLKEDFRDFVKTGTYEEAPTKLEEYIDKFKSCEIKEYEEFTKILVNWKQEIINSFYRPYGDKKLTNAYTERINGEIRKYINVSHGLGNFDRFRKRVLYALNDDIGYSLKPRLDHSFKKKKTKK